MNISLAIIVQARKNSQRCKNKMLRRFSKSSLFEIQIQKLLELSKNYNVYCAVGEKPFFDILKKHKKIKVVERNKISVNSDLIENVFNYLDKVQEDNICFVNPCSPLLKTKTIRGALRKFDTLKLKSLTSVIEKKTWYFDHKQRPINDNSKCNTKVLDPIYECSHSFHIFNRKFFIKNKRYWNNKNKDPYLYKINNLEALDIDTEDEFNFVQNIYNNF